MGYSRAGFDEIVGVDINPQPNYPFTFIQGDATRPPVRLEDFDLIHASPPCQRYSIGTPNSDRDRHPDLVAKTRDLIEGHSYIMENVPSAPMRPDVTLCGSMFNLQIQRHRIFELGEWFVWAPPLCNHVWTDGTPWEVSGHANGWNAEKRIRDRDFGLTADTKRIHHKYRDLAHAQELMGMPWTQTNREVTEAIPPDFTEYLGRQFLDQMILLDER